MYPAPRFNVPSDDSGAASSGASLSAAMPPDVSMLGGLDMALPMDLDLSMDLGDADFASSIPPPLGAGDATAPAIDQSTALGNDALEPYASQSGQQDANLAGAGPLPTGFGVPVQPATNTVTEFTKRRNWSQRIIEEIRDFLHILTPEGRILWVSPSCKNITGHEPHLLLGKFISNYVHPDDGGIFMREFNESIASGNSLRFFYRFKKHDGNYIIFECDGHPHLSPDPSGSSGFGNSSEVQSAGVCRGFFMMARPYPTRNAALLDSFLEHKIENERLLRRVEELRQEEREENAEQDKLLRRPSQAQIAASETDGSMRNSDGHYAGPAASNNYQGMPPPPKPPASNIALTRQNLDSVLSAQRPDSMADKMSRYEANNTHLESIELLTGLQYRDGERSHGISTGDTSPNLIRGSAGIAFTHDRDSRDPSRKEKRRNKAADEYVCADCGTLDSPEWRKGPKGPKTLCNACGLRWAKKEKKRGSEDASSASPTTAAGSGGMAAQRPLPSPLGPGVSAIQGKGMTPSLPTGHSSGSMS